MRETSFPMLTHPFYFCSQRFIEWSLPHCLILWKKGIRSSLFSSKSCEKFRSGFEIFSSFHWSSLTIIIVAHQRDGALASCPFNDSLVQSKKGTIKAWTLALILFIVSSSGRRKTPREQNVNPSGNCFKHRVFRYSQIFQDRFRARVFS